MYFNNIEGKPPARFYLISKQKGANYIQLYVAIICANNHFAPT